MRSLNQALTNRVLLTDGALDWCLVNQDLDGTRDFFGAEGILPVLNLTRRRLIGDAHQASLRAGADVIRCNSAGASPLTLGPLGLGADAFCINYTAAETACAAVDNVPGAGRRRFVLGVIGDDGWRVGEKEIEDAVALQSEALIAGGADGIALAVSTDNEGRGRAFLRGAQRGKAALAADVPLYLFQDQSLAPAPGREDSGVIRYADGSGETAFFTGSFLQRRQVNLVGGGESPQVTARLDTLLRRVAEDGLRPFRGSLRPEVAEDPEVPSSVSHLEPALRAWA